LAVKHEELSHQEIEENDLNCRNHVVDGTCQVQFEKKWKAVAINQNGGALTALFRIQLEG
jgi:hypothetical protein